MMMVAVLAPEVMIIDAISEYVRARYYASQTPNLKTDGWTLTHLRFAAAGGFIHYTRDEEIRSNDMRRAPDGPDHWS